MLPHKEIVLPEVDLSHDEGDGIHLKPGHFAEYWRLCFKEAWTETVARYEASPGDVHAAYWYVDGHPAFWQFSQPANEEYPVNHISRLEAEGALVHLLRDGALRQGWPEIIPFRDEKGIAWGYEFGYRDLLPNDPSYPGPEFDTYHDYEFDGSASTYEEAVIEIAKKIWANYGNDRRVVDSKEWRKGDNDKS